LHRISLVTRWVAVAGIAGAGVFAAIVAKAQPGRTTVTTPTVSRSAPSSGPSSSGLSTVDPATGTQVEGGLQAPDQAPFASGGRAAAVSGGS
jgi:hypothetical protein